MSKSGTIPGQGIFTTPEYLRRVADLISDACDAEDAVDVDELEEYNSCDLCSNRAVSQGLCKACLDHFDPPDTEDGIDEEAWEDAV